MEEAFISKDPWAIAKHHGRDYLTYGDVEEAHNAGASPQEIRALIPALQHAFDEEYQETDEVDEPYQSTPINWTPDHA